MCALVVSSLVLSLIGALLQRAAAAGLGVPARFVLGIGPRLGDREAAPRALEVRPAIVWAWVPLTGGGSRARRALVRAIGPIAIVLVPFAVLVAAIVAHGVPDDSPSERMVVGTVVPGSPAEQARIAPGDTIVSVDDVAIRGVEGVIAAVRDRAGMPTRVIVERDGATRTIELVPGERDGHGVVGVSAEPRVRAAGLGEAIALGASIVAARIELMLPIGRAEPSELAGPVGMVQSARPGSVDGAMRVALIAASWTALAVLWSIVAAISEVVRAARGRS